MYLSSVHISRPFFGLAVPIATPRYSPRWLWQCPGSLGSSLNGPHHSWDAERLPREQTKIWWSMGLSDFYGQLIRDIPARKNRPPRGTPWACRITCIWRKTRVDFRVWIWFCIRAPQSEVESQNSPCPKGAPPAKPSSSIYLFQLCKVHHTSPKISGPACPI